jgi:hypothetical protein
MTNDLAEQKVLADKRDTFGLALALATCAGRKTSAPGDGESEA